MVGEIMVLEESYRKSDDDVLILPGAVQYFNDEVLKGVTTFTGSTHYLMTDILQIKEFEDQRKKFSQFAGLTGTKHTLKLIKDYPINHRGPMIGMFTTHNAPQKPYDDNRDPKVTSGMIRTLFEEVNRAVSAGLQIDSVGIGPLFWDSYYRLTPEMDRIEAVNLIFKECHKYTLPYDVRIYTLG